MNIIAHRGYWIDQSEKNTVKAFIRAFELGYGVETDIRDYKGKLVVSHNVADDSSMSFEEFLILYKKAETEPILALNIKADGLQELLKELLGKYDITNYFLFDMSVPEMVVYDRMGLVYFTRQSDVERECVLYNGANGVWVDTFYQDTWCSVEAVSQHLKKGKKVCYVSPELHGREQMESWRQLKEAEVMGDNNFYICTDKPKDASEYLKGY